MNGVPGEGTRLLASITGQSAERMAGDRRALASGLLALGSEAVSLIRGYASEDLAVREAAYGRWAELDAMLPKPDASAAPDEPLLSEGQRERLRVALTDAVDKLRELEREVIQPAPDDLAH